MSTKHTCRDPGFLAWVHECAACDEEAKNGLVAARQADTIKTLLASYGQLCQMVTSAIRDSKGIEGPEATAASKAAVETANKLLDAVETLSRERDEALAQVAALREAMESALIKITERIAASGGLYDLEVRATRLAVGEILDNALSRPNPGAALLDRLKAAEAVCEASEAHIRCAWSGDESRVGLVSFGAHRGKNEAANSEFARTDRIDETQATAIAALAAWRKLTEQP